MLDNILKEKNKKILLSVIIFSIFMLIYLLNKLYPLHGEDWDYTFIMGTTQRVSSLSDIIKSQYHHYLTWGGRSVTHFIAQFLLMIDLGLAHILNSLAFVCFISIAYYIANMHNKVNIGLFIAIALSLWLLLPNITATAIWITYSANYLWGTLIVLSFMTIYCSYYWKKELRDSKIKSTLMFLGGIIAGWTNENTSLALLFFIFAMILYFKYKKIKIPIWAICGLTGVFIGALALLLAPGNSVRLDDGYIIYDDKVLMIKRRLLAIYKNYMGYVLIPTLIYICSIILFICRSVSEQKKEILFISLLFVLSALVGVGVMIGSPDFPPRTLFCVITFMIIGTGYLYANLRIESLPVRISKWIAITGLLIVCCIDYADKYNYLVYLNGVWAKREQYIKEQKAKGQYDIVFTDNVVQHKDFIVHVIWDDPERWPNKPCADFYGVKSVREIKRKE